MNTQTELASNLSEFFDYPLYNNVVNDIEREISEEITNIISLNVNNDYPKKGLPNDKKLRKFLVHQMDIIQSRGKIWFETRKEIDLRLAIFSNFNFKCHGKFRLLISEYLFYRLKEKVSNVIKQIKLIILLGHYKDQNSFFYKNNICFDCLKHILSFMNLRKKFRDFSRLIF